LGGEKREPETGGKEGKTEGVLLEERSRNRGKETVEKTKEGRVFLVVENREKTRGEKGF
jgi:RNase P/RNase MRP subunit p30